MACVGILEGRRVVAALLSENQWQDVVAHSKRREVFMPDTLRPARAKTLRWDGGITRYFSHFPGETPEGYSSQESPEHMAMKLAIYERLLELGIPAELEAGMDDWRADILVGQSAFSSQLAIEVQLTKQSAQLTYDRTELRRRSGVPTLWLFGRNGSSGHLGKDILVGNPVFLAESPENAASIATAVCRGKAYYDDLSSFKRTPARPIAFLVNCHCGTRWLYPYGLVLLPNRVNGEIQPQYVSCGRSTLGGKSIPLTRIHGAVEAYFDRYMPALAVAAEKYALRLGRPSASGLTFYYSRSGTKSQRVWQRFYECPECTYPAEPLTNGLPTGIDLVKCPVPVITEVDARPVLKCEPRWRTAPVLGYVEKVMTDAQWKATFIHPLREKLAKDFGPLSE